MKLKVILIVLSLLFCAAVAVLTADELPPCDWYRTPAGTPCIMTATLKTPTCPETPPPGDRFTFNALLTVDGDTVYFPQPPPSVPITIELPPGFRFATATVRLGYRLGAPPCAVGSTQIEYRGTGGISNDCPLGQ